MDGSGPVTSWARRRMSGRCCAHSAGVRARIRTAAGSPGATQSPMARRVPPRSRASQRDLFAVMASGEFRNGTRHGHYADIPCGSQSEGRSVRIESVAEGYDQDTAPKMTETSRKHALI